MIPFIPTPKKCQIQEKNCKFPCNIYTEEADWKDYCDTFSDTFFHLFEVRPGWEKGGIVLRRDLGLADGSYVIDCDDTTASDDSVLKVYASGAEGILYGLASLIQIVSYQDGILTVPQMHVEDYPEKDYRAFMVDLGREWHPFQKLLRFVDLCFLYKIKYLHLHLADTLLYALPSKAYPDLNIPHKCYTYEQMDALNAYAKARGIVLIPEYECPGHAPILVKKYPEIFANHFEENISSDFCDEFGNVIGASQLMCAGSEACLEANKVLLKEMADLFPDAPYIHIGGDEANIKMWNYCSDCRKYMADHNISDVYELYSEFVGRIAEYVLSLGKTPIVWEGFPEKGSDRIPKETIVIGWESLYHMPDRLIEEGFRVINASWQPLYVVSRLNRRWDAFDILKWNVYNWQNWLPRSAAYLNPITVPPTDQVLGSMLCSWGLTYERELPFVMENLAAMAERTWTVKRVCTDEEFMPRLQDLLARAERIIQDK